VVGVLVPGALSVKEPVELFLVEEGVLLGSFGNGNNIVEAMLKITGLGGVGAVTVLVVPRWTKTARTC
jgi:hypothetical protein